MPNLVRLWLGEELPEEATEVPEAGTVVVIETNLDDMSGELVPGALDAALAAGALDAWSASIGMKKGRPGLLLRAICPEECADAVAAALLRETTSLGVRLARMERRCLRRERIEVATRFGTVGVKIGYLGGDAVTVSPEYEDCRRAAKEHGTTLKAIYAAAVAAAGRSWTPAGERRGPGEQVEHRLEDDPLRAWSARSAHEVIGTSVMRAPPAGSREHLG